MTEQEINKTYTDIVELIELRRLKDAINKLEMLLNECPDWNLQTMLEQASTSYNYMLQYMLQGITDPERKKLYNNIVIRLLEIADRIHILLLDTVSNSFFHTIHSHTKNVAPGYLMEVIKKLESIALDISVNSLLPDKNKQTQTAKELYRYEKQLFIHNWINVNWSKEDEDAANYLLKSSTFSQNDLCLFISAVTMSLQNCFDLNKLMWLFNAYMQFSSPRIKQRAIIGIFFTLHTHYARLDFYPIVGQRLSLLKDQPEFARDLTQCYINFVYCRETDKINRMMNEEIVPGIIKDMNSMKSSPNKEEDEDLNPQWMFPHIENKELEDKLERLTQMSMEGGDLYMSTFQSLKGFAFFHDLENWFKPFDANQPIIGSLIDPTDKKFPVIINAILKSVYLCDNDKYSLAHIIPQMPAAQFNMMKDQFEQAEEAMDEEIDSNGILSDEDKAYKMENANYIHDLYRFFKLSPRKHEFNDLFKEDIYLYNNKEINSLLFETGNLILLAEFLFKKKYWKEAGNLYDTLIDLSKDNIKDGNLYSHRGFTYQKMKMYGEALRCYLEAELFTPNDNWLKEQIAACYRLNLQFDKALSYYREIESKHPEDMKILFFIGFCLGKLRKFDEALKYFFKIDFIQPDDIKTWRAIAWYSFLCGKLEEAQKYYEKILGKSPITTDYLNAGHVAWCMGNIKNTVDNYRQALALCKDKEEFIMLFQGDTNELILKGIDADSIPLMLDLIDN